MYDLLNGLNEDHVLSLEEFFGERIIVEKLNYNAITNVKLDLDDAEICKSLCNIVGDNHYSMYRDHSNIYITFWK